MDEATQVGKIVGHLKIVWDFFLHSFNFFPLPNLPYNVTMFLFIGSSIERCNTRRTRIQPVCNKKINFIIQQRKKLIASHLSTPLDGQLAFYHQNF